VKKAILLCAAVLVAGYVLGSSVQALWFGPEPLAPKVALWVGPEPL
jgi:hypothetical protein